MNANMTEPQIQAALDAGIISENQAQLMRDNLLSATPSDTLATIGDEDNMRFLRSFSDVFIAIGLILFAFGTAGMASLMGGGVFFIGTAILMGLAAEFFGRRMRAHLPTLILALAFLVFTQRGLNHFFDGSSSLTALITLIAMTLFYWRIRLPFCMALIASSVLFLLFALLGEFAPALIKNYFGPILALSGVTIFGAALAYDVNDQHRTTRFADNAFWLHFLAAPLIIHGIAIIGVSLKNNTLFGFIPVLSLSTADAIFVLLVVITLTLIGLAINRRALIVSALGYTGFAITSLFVDSGIAIATSLLLALLALGGTIVFLGVGWHGARKHLLKFLPKWRVFPPPFDPNFKS